MQNQLRGKSHLPQKSSGQFLAINCKKLTAYNQPLITCLVAAILISA
ncbi:hypothetical protein KZ332_10800 [Glaesserella parasuis]|nr:hypothetical protein HPSMNH_1874 [Glaesserella parasuis MN-H]MCT8738896.1 hypothetical protein [Glaesserella parasuis]